MFPKYGAMALMLMAAAVAHAGVTVSTPTNNATVSSPAHVVASATPSSGYRISAMQIYVNSAKVYSTSASSIDTSVSVKAGTNKIQVKAWDSSGKEFVTTVYAIAGSASSGGGTVTTGGAKLSNIDQLSGWWSCTACAGVNGDGPSASFWMKQGIGSPTLDGNGAQFHLGGSTPYSNALWNHKVITDGAKTRAATHFLYDLYFYYKNAHAAQGMEFNVSQYFDGKGYVYGMQCNIRSGAGPHWDVSVPKDYSKPLTLTNMKWQDTGIACPAPPTYTWNHVVLEVERTTDGKVRYISITLNGSKHFLNITVPRRIAPSDWLGVTTHVQMNGNYTQEDWDMWVDKFHVTSW